ncbi:MAG: hypothetical protein WA936_03420, partial [Erythrobacter sp.]
ESAFGPPAPDSWTWRPRPAPGRRDTRSAGKRASTPEKRGAGKRKPGKDSGRRDDDRRGQGKRPDDRRDQRKGDTGPARAGGAFDKLADLLRE